MKTIEELETKADAAFAAYASADMAADKIFRTGNVETYDAASIVVATLQRAARKAEAKAILAGSPRLRRVM